MIIAPKVSCLDNECTIIDTSEYGAVHKRHTHTLTHTNTRHTASLHHQNYLKPNQPRLRTTWTPPSKSFNPKSIPLQFLLCLHIKLPRHLRDDADESRRSEPRSWISSGGIERNDVVSVHFTSPVLPFNLIQFCFVIPVTSLSFRYTFESYNKAFCTTPTFCLIMRSVGFATRDHKRSNYLKLISKLLKPLFHFF